MTTVPLPIESAALCGMMCDSAYKTGNKCGSFKLAEVDGKSVCQMGDYFPSKQDESDFVEVFRGESNLFC